MTLRKQDVLCLVNLPDKTTLAYYVHQDSKGRDLLKMVCDHLNIIEMDYFGLILKDASSMMTKDASSVKDSSAMIPMWINLRNPIVKETLFQHPIVLDLSVKFFVEFHHLQQNITRQLFFLVAVQNMHSLFLPTTDITTYCSTHFPQMTITHPFLFKSLHDSSLMSDDTTTRRNDFLRLMVPHMEAWGHTHKVMIGGIRLVMIVAQDGIRLYNTTAFQILRMHSWCSIQMASQTSRTIFIKILNSDATSNTTEIHLNLKRDADSLYRDLTEVYSFYCCETVFDSVTQQVSTDFKDLILSLFNEATNMGRRYVFDVEKTLKETYESVRRKLYLIDEDNRLKIGAIRSKDIKLSCLENSDETSEKLQSIIDSFQCRICFSEEISLVFVPCGHMVSCSFCFNKITLCPLCNTDIVNVQKIYLPIQLT